MKNNLKIVLLSLALLMITPAITFAEGALLEPQISGKVEGTSIYFEITNSEYLNISLQSTEEITIDLESISRMISMDVRLSTDFFSTNLTLSGLEPNTTYYKYQDSYKNKAVFVSNKNGEHNWVQDLTQSHHIWIQLEKDAGIQSKDIQASDGVVFLPEECSDYGIWNEETSTCVLTQDLFANMEITQNDITLDCAGHSIIGADTGYGIYVNRKTNVAVKNCTVNNFHSGIYFYYGSNSTLNNNNVSNNKYYGIRLTNSNNAFLEGNIVNSNPNWGISLDDSDNSTVINNTASNNCHGIYLCQCENNVLDNNTFDSNIGYGILFRHVHSSAITENIISNSENKCGFFMSSSGGNTITNNAFINNGLFPSSNNTLQGNTVNGKPLIYLEDISDHIISNTDAGQVILIDCDNITVENLNLSNTFIGILLSNTHNSSIIANNVSESSWGIRLCGSDHNRLFDNTILNNQFGVYIHTSDDNKVYHNNFLNNIAQVSVLYSDGNVFDNNYPSGGNYWSDYTGTDLHSGPNQDEPGSDGIGDTPHTFDIHYTLEDGEDRYPFMEQSGWVANQSPTYSNLDQYKFDGIKIINEGETTTESTVVFKATVSDPDNDQVKLQVEVKECGQSFDELNIIESNFVASGSEASITKEELIEKVSLYLQGGNTKSFCWRARAMDNDNQGGTSEWQEFGEPGNVDFEVKIVPLYTQIESDFPSWEKTRSWFDESYAYATSENPYPSCGWTIGRCGCAMTSRVMIFRFHDITTAVDDNDVNPLTFNNWLTNNEGYYSDGDIKPGIIDKYSKDPQTGITRLQWKGAKSSKDEVTLSIYLNKLNPVILKVKALSNGNLVTHYVVADGELDNTYTVKDSSWYNTKYLNQTAGSFAQNYHNSFSGLRLFSPEIVIREGFFSIHLCSPAELLVTDPQGRRLGKDPVNDISYNEIPNSSYYSDEINNPFAEIPAPTDESKNIWIPDPVDGEYNIQVIGTDSGKYTMEISVHDQDDQLKDIIKESNTTTNNIQEFELNYSTETIDETEFYQVVDIDIKPGSYPNSINLKSKGVIPVAVLTNEFFNAEDVVIDSVVFAGAKPLRGNFEDVDNDDDLDLILHFKTQSLQLAPGDTEAVLIAQLNDNTLIKGTDSIRVVGKLRFLASITESISGWINRIIESIKEFFSQIHLYFLNLWVAEENEEIEESQRTHSVCLSDDEVAAYEIREKKRGAMDNEAVVIMSINDKKTGAKEFDFQIDNVRINYRPIEVHKCGVYIVKRFNYDYKKIEQDPGSDYKEELWKYDYNGNGETLILLAEKPKEFIAYYSTDFRVDPTENYIVLIRSYLGQPDYALVIKDLETKEDVFVLPLKDISNLEGSIGLRSWTKDGRYFWGDIFVGAYVLAFFRIDTVNWNVEVFEIPEGVLGGSALNIEKGYVTQHPGHVWTGIDILTEQIKEEWREQGKISSLYLYNLFTKERTLLATTDEPLWRFKPKWLSDTELEYELPNGERKIYKINSQ
jgi:parallel beta-helix repeat protein